MGAGRCYIGGRMNGTPSSLRVGACVALLLTSVGANASAQTALNVQRASGNTQPSKSRTGKDLADAKAMAEEWAAFAAEKFDCTKREAEREWANGSSCRTQAGEGMTYPRTRSLTCACAR